MHPLGTPFQMKQKARTRKQPFCWQEKHVLRTIREMFEQTGNAGSALLVYHALTEIASDKQSDVFVTTCACIGQRAGLSARTVNRIIPVFERLGIIGIKRNKINGVNGPSTYTVVRDAKPLRTVVTPCRRVATNCNAQSRSLEESLEESPEDTHHSDEWRCYYSNDEQNRYAVLIPTDDFFCHEDSCIPKFLTIWLTHELSGLCPLQDILSYKSRNLYPTGDMIGLLRQLHRKHGRLIEQMRDALKKAFIQCLPFLVPAFSTLFANVSLLLSKSHRCV